MTAKPERVAAEVVARRRERSAEVPARARRAAQAWGARSRQLIRQYPVGALLGAFVIGVALARVARHA